MWDLPRPGLEPTSPALAGGFLTTAPPGKSQRTFSWARDVCSDVTALHLCVIPDSAPRSPNLTQGRAPDGGAHSRNCTWPTFLPKISLMAHNVHHERHPGTEPAGSTGSWSCPHSLWGLHPLRGGQRSANASWQGHCGHVVGQEPSAVGLPGFESWPYHILAVCPWTSYLTSIFFNLWNGNHAYLIGY